MFSEEQIRNLYSDRPRPQILQRAHDKFQLDKNYYLDYELVTIYVLSILKKRDSYAWEMEQELAKRTIFRMSSSMLSKVLEDLSTSRVVNTYIHKSKGRGRPKIMYKLSSDWYYHAVALVGYWEIFNNASQLFQLVKTLNTSNPSEPLDDNSYKSNKTAKHNLEQDKLNVNHNSDKNNHELVQNLDETELENEIKKSNHIIINPDRYPQIILSPNEFSQEPAESKAKWAPIDKAGIAKALEWELQHGRIPEKKAHNYPGYDIESCDLEGNVRYIEVKSLQGKWDSGNVYITQKQFEVAQKLGENYWLYVVEEAQSKEQFYIYQISNPAHQNYRISYNSNWKKYSEKN
jgi:DNA-binding PadR family transcriptional regulator